MTKTIGQHINMLNVSLDGQTVGVLAIDDQKRIWFEYSQNWIASGFNLAPKAMAFDAKPQLARDNLFQGLHGAFSDSLPDGWGLLLMDREFKKRFDWKPYEVMPLDRLAYMGARSMGALEYAPIYAQEPISDKLDIASLANSVDAILKGKEDEVITQLTIQGGSPGGTRPKVTIARSESSDVCLSGFQILPEDYSHWIIKFKGEDDPEDMGQIERAYAELANLAGVQMPRTDLIAVSKGGRLEHYFAVERFDREGKNGKRHVLSLAGFLYANYRMPCLDYEGVLGSIAALTNDHSQIERGFRLMAFNVLAHNRDDHVKNFAFLFSKETGWKLSPAFDLTFSAGMGGEHMTSVSGKGHPVLQDVLKVGGKFHIANALQIIGEVRCAVSQWTAIAKKWKLGDESASMVQAAISKVDKGFAEAPMKPYQASGRAKC
ncbi:type II toxin-antitoxin system HipA family toxin [Propionivibrio sp.]|uniref:type II toxin-antitoxin system HipA family toxin n=1 Tax=Propionivibrio sp. TaxID=2212460 RepID=UPI003BF3874A